MILSLLFALLIDSQSRADDSDIHSNRPGQSIGATTVGDGIFQVESGFDRLGSSGATEKTRTEIFENSLRYGVNERFEVLFNVNLQWDHIGDLAQSGVSVLDPGVNFALIPEASGFIPSLALQTRFHLTNSSAVYRASQVAPSLILASSHDLGNDFNFDTNVGMDYDGNTPVPKFLYIANFGFPIHGNLSGFVEAYGNMKNSAGNIDYDAGLAWILNPDLQLDMSGGGGSNRGLDDYFFSAGISWRAHTRVAAAVK